MKVRLVSHSTPVEEEHGKNLLEVVAYCARVSNPSNQSNMNTTTLNQPIVIDNGTGVMKAGFGG